MYRHHRPDALASEVREIMAHAQALVEATADELDDRVAKVRTDLKYRLDKAREKYGDLECTLKDKMQVADEYVRDKPYHAMGVSLLAGLFLGFLARRK